MSDKIEITPVEDGFQVKINDRVKLPGIFTSAFMAMKAAERYINKSVETKLSKGK